MFWKLGGEGPQRPRDSARLPRAGARGGGAPALPQAQ